MQDQSNSRRDFLKQVAAGAAVAAAASLNADNLLAAAPKSKVVIAQDAKVRTATGTLDPARVQALLDRAMQSFFDSKKPVDAWKKVVKPGEVVGIKVNCLGGPRLANNLSLLEAIVERVQQAGIKPENIIVWDRSTREMDRVGVKAIEHMKVRCIGNDEAGFEDDLSTYGSVSSRLSKTLTRTCDAVINVPLLKDHGMAGVTGALKNMYGVVNNPNKLHPNGCNPYVADLNMLAPIRQKFRLNICDALQATCEGGPGFSPQWVWNYNGVLVARDPVAMDTVIWDIIEKKRAENGLKSLTDAGRPPRYIATAADAQHRLGTNDPKMIQRVQV